MSTGKTIRRKIRGLAMRRVPLMVTCEELEGFIVNYFDDALPYWQRQKFELHLRLCPCCRRYIENYKQTIALSQAAFDDGDLSNCENMPEALVQAILTSRNKDP